MPLRDCEQQQTSSINLWLCGAQVADMYRAQAVVKAHRQEAGGEDGEEDM